MIQIPFPHMALNSHELSGVFGTEIRMWHTWTVPESFSTAQIADKIAAVAKTAPGGKLKSVVFNSHGNSGKIWVGQHIHLNSMAPFKRIKGLVEQIWIVACRVANISQPGLTSDGNYFCYRFAQVTGAYVIASSDSQVSSGWERMWLLPGYIDDMEGNLYKWNPNGEPSKFVPPA